MIERRQTSPARLVALGAMAALVNGLTHAGGTIDDAYISFRYANNLAHGRGLVFNPGERVEGFTNPLWTSFAALVLALEHDPVVVLPAVALVCFVVLVALSRRWASVLTPERPWAGVGAAALVAPSMGLAFYAASGLETVPYALVVTAAVVALLRVRTLAFVGLTTLAWTLRPEAALLGVVGTLWLAFRAPAGRREALRAVVGFGGLVVPLLLLRYAYFHDVVPNTARAKPPSLGNGLAYLSEAWPFLPIVALGALGAARGNATTRTLFGLWALHLVAVAVVGGDWMPAHRMLLPTLPWLALCADGALLEASGLLRSGAGRRRVAGGVVCLVAALWVWRNVEDTRVALAVAETRSTVDAMRLHTLARLTHQGMRSLALYDIGLVGYVARDVVITDLGGLTDRHIAAAPGALGRKPVDAGYLASRAPEVVWLTSEYPPLEVALRVAVPMLPRFGGERSLWESPRFHAAYHYLCTLDLLGYQLVHVFVRRAGRSYERVPDRVCRRPPSWIGGAR